MITAILLLIAISNRLVVLLARAVNSQFPLTAIVQAVLLIIPELLTMVLPIALFCALIFSQSRMYADNEMVVLFASGFTLNKLVRLNVNMAWVVTAMLLYCTLYVNPLLNHLRNKIAQEQYSSSIHLLITPGKFQSLLGGRLILYAETVHEGIIKNVFMVLKNKKLGMPDAIVTAKVAKIDKEILTLYDGNRYDGIPGQADYKVISFAEYSKPLVLNSERLFERPEKLTVELLASTNLNDRVELQVRLAMPFVTLVLAILAIFLAKVNPRSGRFHNFIPAILVFIVYYNLLIFANKMMLQAKVPLYSLWLIHLVFLLYAYYKIRRVAL